MGYTGVCIASSLQWVARLLATMYFMRVVKEPKITDHNNEPFFTATTVTDLKYMAKISALQCVMGVWNWWGLEFFTLSAAYVNTTALAAQSVFRALS